MLFHNFHGRICLFHQVLGNFIAYKASLKIKIDETNKFYYEVCETTVKLELKRDFRKFHCVVVEIFTAVVLRFKLHGHKLRFLYYKISINFHMLNDLMKLKIGFLILFALNYSSQYKIIHA